MLRKPCAISPQCSPLWWPASKFCWPAASHWIHPLARFALYARYLTAPPPQYSDASNNWGWNESSDAARPAIARSRLAHSQLGCSIPIPNSLPHADCRRTLPIPASAQCCSSARCPATKSWPCSSNGIRLAKKSYSFNSSVFSQDLDDLQLINGSVFLGRSSSSIGIPEPLIRTL